MAIPNLTFNIGQGGLGRPLPGKDHYSGYVGYIANADLPTGFTTNVREKVVYSITDAETLGFAEGSATNGEHWYHINQFFYQNPLGVLYIGLYDIAAIDYSKIKTLQIFADGDIRQVGVYDPSTALSTTNINTLQTHADTLVADYMPLLVVYACDTSGTADQSTLADLSALTSERVMVTIGQDGDADGAALFTTSTDSITDLGAFLGALSLAKVNESIAWIQKFSAINGAEFVVPAFGNGDLVKSYSTSKLNTIETRGYNFQRKIQGSSGTHWIEPRTCIAASNDFAYAYNIRTMDKATRGIRSFVLPNLSGPITLNSDGTLREETIALLKNDAGKHLIQMERDQEISAYKVEIDSSQDVLSTGELEMTIFIVPVGVAKQITINIGFTTQI
jgi:hypothetical protein